MDRVGWRNKGLVQGDSGAWNSPEVKVDRGALLGVNIDFRLTEPVLDVEVLLEVEGSYGGLCVGR